MSLRVTSTVAALLQLGGCRGELVDIKASPDASTDYYELRQREGRAEILPGLDTTVWGYDGIFPGPTIEARSGRRVVVHQRNGLPVPTVVHLHGGVTPPESDGYPTDLILPADGSFDGHEGHGRIPMGRVDRGIKEYVYPMDQPAATLWYHDHRMDFTGPQVHEGLAGFHIVRDEVEDDLPLPKGEKDVPLMICDRAFEEDGSFLYPSVDRSLRDEPGVKDDFMEGVLADTILVNGAPWPFMEVSNTMYRFRILNASNARRYELKLDPPPSGGDSFIQVGSDVGLLSAGLPRAYPDRPRRALRRGHRLLEAAIRQLGQDMQDGQITKLAFLVKVLCNRRLICHARPSCILATRYLRTIARPSLTRQYRTAQYLIGP